MIGQHLDPLARLATEYADAAPLYIPAAGVALWLVIVGIAWGFSR